MFTLFCTGFQLAGTTSYIILFRRFSLMKPIGTLSLFFLQYLTIDCLACLHKSKPVLAMLMLKGTHNCNFQHHIWFLYSNKVLLYKSSLFATSLFNLTLVLRFEQKVGNVSVVTALTSSIAKTIKNFKCLSSLNPDLFTLMDYFYMLLSHCLNHLIWASIILTAYTILCKTLEPLLTFTCGGNHEEALS